MQARKIIVAVAALLLAGAAMADTHAPWPADWDNWSDPALWVQVGNPGNSGELSGQHAGEVFGPGGWGPDAIVGAVNYTFKVGKYEVTAGQYTPFLNAVAKTDTYGLYNTNMDTAVDSLGCNIKRTGSSGEYKYTVESDWANRPVNYVSWGDSARFANWLTNGQPTGAQDANTTEDGSYNLSGAVTTTQLLGVTRITDQDRIPGNKYCFVPTEDESYKAAYYDPNKPGGTGYWDYPTCLDIAPSNVVTDPDPGNNANYSSSIGGLYYRTPVGEFENSDSFYGTFDQGGNVWEWNEAVLYGSYRGVRGGSFDNNGGDTLLAACRAGYNDPADEREVIGFHISEVPDPATLSLLALGGLTVMRRRRGEK